MARIPGDPTPPTPLELIKSVLPASSPVRELRKQKLLSTDSPLVPDEMKGHTVSAKYEVETYWDDSKYTYDESHSGYDAEFDPTLTDRYGRSGTHVDPFTSSIDTSPAPISLMPTSSIYPQRPRTVAAGFDPSRRVLTVVFRDGTFYNYYNVTNTTWGNFKRAHSKGQYIKTFLDGHHRGAAGADASLLKAGHMEALYRAARTAQALANGLQKGQKSGRRRKDAWNKSSYRSYDRATNTAKRNAAWNNRTWGPKRPGSRPF